MKNDVTKLFEVYCDLTKLAHSTVSIRAAKNSTFYQQLKAGKNEHVSLRRLEAAAQWFSDNWPLKPSGTSQHPWPVGIKRPAKTKKEDA